MASSDTSHFRYCSSCKQEISFEQKYWTCSVSTCNRPRTGLFFCSVQCWEAHVPMMRHRDAWAEENRAPSRSEWLAQEAAESRSEAAAAPAKDRRIVASTASSAAASTPSDQSVEREILVVVSKLKNFVRARSGMNTSDGVVEVLSDHLRDLCGEAIRNAARDGRRTVMDRDFIPLFARKP